MSPNPGLEKKLDPMSIHRLLCHNKEAEWIILDIIKKYNEKNKDSEPYSIVDNLKSFKIDEYHQKIYYSKRESERSFTKYIINSIDKSKDQTQLEIYLINYIWFLYRKTGAEWELYALTTGNGYRVVRPFIDYSFSMKIARRVMVPFFSNTETKFITGNRDSASEFHREDYDLEKNQLDSIWCIFLNFKSSFKKSSSIYNPEYGLKICPKENKKIGVDFSSGRILISKKLEVSQYGKILKLFSIISSGEKTYYIDPSNKDKKEEEKDDHIFTCLENIQVAHDDTLEDLLVENIWDLYQGKPIAGQLWFVHKNFSDFYNSYSFKLKYEEHIIGSWEYYPSLNQVLEMLRNHWGTYISHEQFRDKIYKSKLKFSRYHQFINLLDFFEGELHRDGITYFRFLKLWLQIKGESLVIFQKSFYTLIKNHYIHTFNGVKLKPWIAKKEWIGFTLEEAHNTTGINEDIWKDIITNLKNLEFSFIDTNGKVIFNRPTPCITEKSEKLKKIILKNWDWLVEILGNQKEELTIDSLTPIFKKKAKEVHQHLQTKHPFIVGSKQSKKCILDNDGNRLVSNIDGIILPKDLIKWKSNIANLIKKSQVGEEEIKNEIFPDISKHVDEIYRVIKEGSTILDKDGNVLTTNLLGIFSKTNNRDKLSKILNEYKSQGKKYTEITFKESFKNNLWYKKLTEERDSTYDKINEALEKIEKKGFLNKEDCSLFLTNKLSKDDLRKKLYRKELDNIGTILNSLKKPILFQGSKYLVQFPPNLDSLENFNLSGKDKGSVFRFLTQEHKNFCLVTEEEGYNRRYLKKEGFLVFDQVYPSDKEKYELFDILQYPKSIDENLYLFHVKEGFGQKTRDACSQIRIAALGIRNSIEKDYSLFKTIYDSATDASAKMSPFGTILKEKLENLGSKNFVDLFRRKRRLINFVYAFIDSADGQERLLSQEKDPFHQFSENDFFFGEADLDILKKLLENGFIDNNNRLTNRFLQCTKSSFKVQLNKYLTQNQCEQVFNTLAKYISPFDTIIAKGEILETQKFIQSMGFSFKICQIPRKSIEIKNQTKEEYNDTIESDSFYLNKTQIKSNKEDINIIESESDSEEKKQIIPESSNTIVGLYNQNNDCFFNSAIQLLFHSCLYQYLIDDLFLDQKEAKREMVFAFIKDLDCRYHSLEEPSIDYLSETMRSLFNFSEKDQEDSSEAILNLCNFYNLTQFLFNTKISIRVDLKKAKLEKEIKDMSVVDENGTLSTSSQQLFFILNLSDEPSFQGLVNSYFTMNHVDCEFKFKYQDKAYQVDSYEKKEDINGVQDFLFIKIKRYNENGQKILTLLPSDISSFTISGQQTYVLDGFIYHKGNKTSEGHYTTYCNIANGWKLFNDTEVKSIASDKAIKKARKGYIFYYKLKTLNNSNQ